jgi:hypothetical protein
MELHPEFLSTTHGKILFFFGSLLLGSAISDLYSYLEFTDSGVDRLLCDLLAGIVYFLICRISFFSIQRLKPHKKSESNAS